MDRKLLVQEFLDALEERAVAQHKGALHQAFVDWFIEAEFGRVDWKFTDDAGDGGIDAVVFLPNDRVPVVVLQFKFSERVGRALLSPRAYQDFDEVVDAFYERADSFNEFIGGVREDAKATYHRAKRLLQEVGNWNAEKKSFRLITTCHRRRKLENKKLPDSAYQYADDVLDLYARFRKGRTPNARALELRVPHKLPYKDQTRRVTSYLFNARMDDFKRYCESTDVGRLVARNIRYNLAGKVGKDIRTTYESNPHDFWYVHNGITIICDGYSERKGLATLINPSVVNGAQTLYAIAASGRRSSSALVATRVVVRGLHKRVAQEDDEWVQTIIRGVNTQNRVKAQDFRSNEPAQLELQRLFRDQRVFYERKRGEWREHRNDPRFRRFDRTSLKNVGFALAAVKEADGSGVVSVKRGAEALFGDDKKYLELFPSRTLARKRFEQIYFAYRVAEFIGDHAYKSARQFRRERHSYWTIVWLTYQLMTSQPRFFSRASVRSIKEAFEGFDAAGGVGNSARRTIRQVRAAVWSAWRMARRSDQERWTANNFFKSAWGHQQVQRLAARKVRKQLKALATECLR